MALLHAPVLWALAVAHPPRGRLDPPRSEACETGNVTFYSYHAHVVFEDREGSPSRAAALQLQRDFAQAFGIDAEVDPLSCDDSATTHGLNPSLCMLDADYGPWDPDHGHWGSPACPFMDAEWAAFVPIDRYQAVAQWFAQHRGLLDIMLHPNSGCETYDHRDWPFWAGKRHALNLTCLHYDCPGCTGDDCRTHGEQVVLNRTADSCGLQVDRVASALRLVDTDTFCRSRCQHWARVELPRWAAECPYNCDMFANQSQEVCAAHAASLEDVGNWSLEFCRTLV